MNAERITQAFKHLEPADAADQLDKVNRFVLEALADDTREQLFQHIDSGLFDGLLMIGDMAKALRSENE